MEKAIFNHNNVRIDLSQEYVSKADFVCFYNEISAGCRAGCSAMAAKADRWCKANRKVGNLSVCWIFKSSDVMRILAASEDLFDACGNYAGWSGKKNAGLIVQEFDRIGVKPIATFYLPIAIKDMPKNSRGDRSTFQEITVAKKLSEISGMSWEAVGDKRVSVGGGYYPDAICKESGMKAEVKGLSSVLSHKASRSIRQRDAEQTTNKMGRRNACPIYGKGIMRMAKWVCYQFEDGTVVEFRGKAGKNELKSEITRHGAVIRHWIE